MTACLQAALQTLQGRHDDCSADFKLATFVNDTLKWLPETIRISLTKQVLLAPLYKVTSLNVAAPTNLQHWHTAGLGCCTCQAGKHTRSSEGPETNQ